MADSGDRTSFAHRKQLGFRQRWCCAFTAPPSPENRSSARKPHKSETSKAISNSYPNSPINSSSSSRLGLGFGSRIDPRRILSPGRVSPIDSDPLDPLPEMTPESEPESVPPLLPARGSAPSRQRSSRLAATVTAAAAASRGFDLRLDLKGKDGKRLSLEMDSRVLASKSQLFAAKIADSRRRNVDEGGWCLIEVVDVGNLEVFRETIELMYEKDVLRRLMKIGVSRSIDILEVSSTIMFDIGVTSCLKYIEAVPWCESEEEKLKSLFSRCTFDEVAARDVLSRLHMQEPVSQPLAIHLLQSIARGGDANARRELKSLVKGLLSTSSVYRKDPAGINKEALYRICDSCISLLKDFFKEASESAPMDRATMKENKRPLIGRISEQVDNLNWVLEILIDRQMAEEFVMLWASQRELLRMHGKTSPMVRYELSRISAHVFIALGRGKLQCRGEERYSVLQAWFGPMLTDFGWLQRCSKGLDLRELEDAMGQALLTLSLRQQQSLFLEWFGCFSGCGTECPNLSRAFQIWWRRSCSTVVTEA